MTLRRDLFDAADDELLLEFGIGLSGGVGAFPLPDDEYRKKAREWLEKRVEEAKRVLCRNNTIRHLSKDGFTAELVAAVAALLESIVVGTAAAPLAILLCKQGVVGLCSGIWDQK